MLKPLLRAALALALLSSPVLGQQVWKWSQTPASNSVADPAINWATGMAPSAVSPSARAMMSGVAKYRDDTAGRLTTGGSSTAYTVTTNSSYASPPADGTRIGLTFHATNGSSPTLAADSGTAYPIRVDASNAVPGATLIAGSPYDVVFSTGSSGWIVVGYFGSPTTVPIGGIIDYVGSVAPNSNFALANGQCISRTTYAAFFALVATSYGSCDGSTTFGVPDLRGRVVGGMDTMGASAANRITSAGSGIDGTLLGSSGGAQNHVLTIPELPVVTPAGAIQTFTPAGSISSFTPSGFINSITPTGTVTLSAASTNVVNSGAGGGANLTGGGGALLQGTITASFAGNAITPLFTGNLIQPTFTGNLLAPNFTGTPFGSGSAHVTVPPMMLLSKLIRIF